jgi:hypothetical protein
MAFRRDGKNTQKGCAHILGLTMEKEKPMIVKWMTRGSGLLKKAKIPRMH